MSARELLKSTQHYFEMLKTFPEDKFLKSPADKTWSISEVYHHILQVNTYSLLAIEKCLHSKQTSPSRPISFLSKMILFFGRFPGKLKAPENLASSVKKISMEEASNGLIKLKHRIEAITPKVSKDSSACTIEHPRLGMLNSKQWLRFMEIHNNHHLKQIDRIRRHIS